jgi:uncharacterized protein
VSDEVQVLRPVTDDPDTGGFWKAAAEGQLAVLVCSDCGEPIHMPKAYCDVSDSWQTEWRTVNPTGTLYSWTVVERQIHPAYPAPFTVVLVSLDDYPSVRLVGNIDGRPELTAGMPMRCVIDESNGFPLPQWYPQ